jgi:ketosteroid isomerase-like protein
MGTERIDRLRAGLDAFERTGRIEPGLISPDFELHQASSIIDSAGTFSGPDAFQRVLSELQESFGDLSFERERFVEAPGGEIVVLVHVRGRGRGSRIEIDNHIAWVWTLDEDGVIRRLVVHEEPADALRSVGIPE